MIENLSTGAFGAGIGRLLPVELAALEKAKTPLRLFLTLSMQRSGQHLIIRWLCRSLGEAIHFNFCHFRRRGLAMALTPRTGRRVVYQGDAIDDSGIQTAADLYPSLPAGRFAALLYSLEDHDPADPLLRRIIHRYRHCLRVLVVLRDPYNWLASTMQLQDEPADTTRRRLERCKRYLTNALHEDWPLSCPVTVVKYDRFVLDPAYRRQLARELEVPMRPAAEAALQEVPAFGGGSSFSGTAPGADLRNAVFERWRHFVDDPHYLAVAQDRELAALDSALFPDVPSAAARRAALGVRADSDAA